MTYYGISPDEMDGRRSHYEQHPDDFGIYHDERGERHVEWIGEERPLVKGREFERKNALLRDDEWTYENDGTFVLDFLRSQSRPSSQYTFTSPPCDTCAKLSRRTILRTMPDKLLTASKCCKLCGLLAQGFMDSGAPDDEEVEVALRMDSDGVVFLMLRVESGPWISLPLLRSSGFNTVGLTCRSTTGTGEPPRDIPIGFPPLRDETSRFDLFRAWLKDCDGYCAPKGRFLPTRILDLSDSSLIRLVDGQRDWSQEDLGAAELRPGWLPNGDTRRRPMTAGNYVALSHRWRSSDEHNFCTYQCNLAARQAGFPVSDLPKRFQDAVTITRELGLRFLWIDSICIVQPHRDATADCVDGCSQSDDWRSECGKMGGYFGSAYLTLAATSAINTALDERILGSGLPPARAPIPGSLVWVWDPAPLQSGAFDDFACDVEDSELNQRGWVLQERALSRRMIHFTSKQAYWECGCGIRCESFVRLRNRTAAFLSDSHFPAVAARQFDQNRLYLLRWLFEKYSRCGLTTPTDRSVAIHGLEERLGEVLRPQWRYGVFQLYFHRCLIWHPAGGQRIKRVDPKVPSWSWMAYTGEITFMNILFEKVSWNLDIQGLFESPDNDSPGFALRAQGRELQSHGTDEEWGQLMVGDEERHPMAGEDERQQMVEEDDYQLMIRIMRRQFMVGEAEAQLEVREEVRHNPRRWLQFDQGNVTDRPDIERLRYVVLGKSKRWERESRRELSYYVLVVKPSEGGSDQEYERVGIGSLWKKDLSSHFEVVNVI
ncbi:hypothetical protein MAPG_03518 [Magnaporthiopsis poae ATCC 64411]|uniref:Heterokaryon incompatibility domain-containing protein n=1 Tax=Magnaporthiopsis poae (strain ATCC 64411 / 73-15) TaxID=644358 RepID=A0A0C4DU80_MAGP6|nr:hypothetical protein MAPG_03518 [Magnaporthiopsis poae ATCC 64411]